MLELLDQIDRYLVGDLAERDLELWLIASLQRILDSNDPNAVKLANAADAGLIQLREEVIDHAEFHAMMDILVRSARTCDVEFAEVVPAADNAVESANDSLVLDAGDRFSLVTDHRVEHSFA